jgi:hypothetical protein
MTELLTYEHCLYEHIAIFQPSVRLVIVDGWTKADQYRSAVRPVLGVWARNASLYWKQAKAENPGRTTGRNQADLLSAGFTYAGDDLAFIPLVAAYQEVLPVDSSLFDQEKDRFYRAVPCLWPADEDSERLAEVAAEVKNNVLDAFRERKRLEALTMKEKEL